MLLSFSRSWVLLALCGACLISPSSVTEAVPYGRGARGSFLRQPSSVQIDLYHTDPRQSSAQSAGRRSGARGGKSKSARTRRSDHVEHCDLRSFGGSCEAPYSSVSDRPPPVRTERPRVEHSQRLPPAPRWSSRFATLAGQTATPLHPPWDQGVTAEASLGPQSVVSELHPAEGCYRQVDPVPPSAYASLPESMYRSSSVSRPLTAENYDDTFADEPTPDESLLMLITGYSFEEIRSGACDVPLLRPAMVDALIASRQVKREGTPTSSIASLRQPATSWRHDPFDEFTQREMLSADRSDKFCPSWSDRKAHLRLLREVNEQMPK